MYSLRDDYSEGGCPAVMSALSAAAGEQNITYGEDAHCEAAAAKILALCGDPDAEVAFLNGGTQTNLLVISALLRPYESAIAAATGHINVHETGAIEATGHKVCTIPAPEGKLTPELIESVVSAHTDEHMVKPRLVYISDSTELGTVYTKDELAAIRGCCLEHGLYLYLDGARLGAAMTCAENDMELSDIAALTDVFYIGGTKNGALFGEALVMRCPELRRDFRYMVKQRGPPPAKGFPLGVQFEALFDGGKDSLWFALAAHENEAASRIAAAAAESGYGFTARPQTNQLFVAMPDARAKELSAVFPFHAMGSLPGGRTVARLVTSWAIPVSATDEICAWFSSHPAR